MRALYYPLYYQALSRQRPHQKAAAGSNQMIGYYSAAGWIRTTVLFLRREASYPLDHSRMVGATRFYLGGHPYGILFPRYGGSDENPFLRWVEQTDHKILHQSGLVH